MDVIASTAFGMDINSQKDTENEFVKKGKLVASNALFANPFVIIGSKKVFTLRLQVICLDARQVFIFYQNWNMCLLWFSLRSDVLFKYLHWYYKKNSKPFTKF